MKVYIKNILKSEIKVSMGEIFFGILTMMFLLPTYFRNFGPIYTFYYDLLPFISLPLIFLNLYCKKNRLFIGAISLFYILIILSTEINGASSTDFAMIGITALGFCSLLNYLFQKECNLKYLQVLTMVYELYVIINLISIILFPDGLYIIYGYNDSYYNEAYILGNRNNAIEYMIPLIGLSVYSDILKGKKWSVNTIFIMTVCMFTAVLTWSVNSILCIAFIIGGNIIIWIKKKMCLFNILTLFSGAAFFSYALIILKIQERFRNFIVDVLHRDVSLSSRSYIWEKAIVAIENKFWMGYGIEKQVDTYSKIGHMSSCHNYFLDYLYLGGVVLLSLIIIMVFIVHKYVNQYAPNVSARISIIYGAYFILWIATPIHKELIFILFSFMIITLCINWKKN